MFTSKGPKGCNTMVQCYFWLLGLKCGVRNVSGHFLFAISEKKVNENGSTPEVAHQKIEINLSQPLKKAEKGLDFVIVAE